MIFTANDKERYELLVYYFRKFVSKKKKYNEDNKVTELELFKKDIEKEINFVMKKWIILKLDEVFKNHTETPEEEKKLRCNLFILTYIIQSIRLKHNHITFDFTVLLAFDFIYLHDKSKLWVSKNIESKET